MYTFHNLRKNRFFTRSGGPAVFLVLLAASPAEAEPGGIVVLRDVPTRNAILPGAGEALTVTTAPQLGAFTQTEGIVQLLDDDKAGAIFADVGRQIEAVISHDVTARLAGDGNAIQGSSLAVIGGEGLGSAIGGHVGTATSALQGALSNLNKGTGGGR